MTEDLKKKKYIVTTAFMGFGHLRAAHNITSVSGAPVVRVDAEPYLNPFGRFIWKGSQYLHGHASRGAEGKNRLLYKWFENLQRLPDDHQPPSLTESKFVRFLERNGMGDPFFDSLDGEHPTLVHTFYLHAMFSEYRSYPGRGYLLLCDTDFHRVWAPLDPPRRNLTYMVPVSKSADRLMSYGVPAGKIVVTGFPLPAANTGKGDLRVLDADFEARRQRLKRDSEPPLTIMFPFSGSGAYSNVLADIVKSLTRRIKDGGIRLIVSCGNNELAFAKAKGLFMNYGLEESKFAAILYEPDIFHSFDRFNQALKGTDMIVTKPGELVFYSALGLPMILLPPIGGHEKKNREYLIDNGSAVDFPGADKFPEWVDGGLREGKLLELAEAGYRNLTKTGAFTIDELAGGSRDERIDAEVRPASPGRSAVR